MPKILYSVHQFLKVAMQQKLSQGFARVLSGGRVIRLDVHKPFTERLIGLGGKNFSNASKADYHQAILQSVQANLEAGLAMIDAQELALAKMGGDCRRLPFPLTTHR